MRAHRHHRSDDAFAGFCGDHAGGGMVVAVDDRNVEESHGLGLAIAKAQANYLGASIVLNSASDKGAVFTLCGLLWVRMA